MPIKTDIISDLELALIKIEGKVDDRSAYKHLESIAELAGFKSTYNVMIDARLMTENLLSPEGVIKMSSDTPFEQSIKRAYVVGDEKAGMHATLFGSTASIEKYFFVTYDMEDACEWLGISPNDISTSSVYTDAPGTDKNSKKIISDETS